MDPEQIKQLIADYGYFAVAIGTLWDSSGIQTFVVGGGAAAGMTGELTLIGVILAATIGNLSTDLVFYGIGRWRAMWLDRVVRSKKNRARLDLLSESMHRHAWPLMIFGRFMPWIGRFIPAVAGIRHVRGSQVIPAMVVGAFLAGAFYAMLGYGLGTILEAMEGYIFWVIIGSSLASIPVTAWILHRFDRKVQERLARNNVSTPNAPAQPAEPVKGAP